MRTLVQPVYGEHEVLPSEAAPLEQRLLVQQSVEAAEEPGNAPARPEIAGRRLVLRQRLHRDEDRPRIVRAPTVAARRVPDRSEPPVWLLALEDLVDPTLRLGKQRLVAEEVREWHHAVEPVGAALPALGVPADPSAIGDVGPELVQMTAQPVSLDA